MTYLSLYRKWRPQQFRDLAGQDYIRDTLQAALRSDKIQHAYLFAGSRGTGKTTTARLLAKAVNCLEFEAKNAEPCNHCANCVGFNQGKSLDLIEIDAASNTSVEQARDLVEKIRYVPVSAKYKVFVIDEVHMLSKAAFDALLKTLEEPPAHAIFILATTEVHRIPDTILSRCQRFDFRQPNLNQIVARLSMIADKEKIKIDADALHLLAELAAGSFRDAESLLDQVYGFAGSRISTKKVEQILGLVSSRQIWHLVDLLISADLSAGMRLINELQVAGYDLADFNRRLVEWLRLLMMKKIAIDQATAEQIQQEQEKLKEQAQKLSLAKIVMMIRVFSESQLSLKGNLLPSLPLELAIIKIVDPAETAPATEKSPLAEEKSPIPTPPKVKIVEAKEEPRPVSDQPAPKLLKSTKGLEIDQIILLWPQFLVKIKEQNHSLYACFKEVVPIEFADGCLILATKYKFFQEKMMTVSTKRIIEEVLSQSVGRQAGIQCCLSSEVDQAVLQDRTDQLKQKEPQDNNQLAHLAADVFELEGDK